MSLDWKKAFTQLPAQADESEQIPLSLSELKKFLDFVHIKECLLRPLSEQEEYPFIESKDLLPSFDSELIEYSSLPGFSLVVFDRPLHSFDELFQYDILTSEASIEPNSGSVVIDTVAHTSNLQTVSSRLSKSQRSSFIKEFNKQDITSMDSYESMIPYLLMMDRAQVIAKNNIGRYYLAGIFASFPSDFDGELKRFGIQIGKFKVGNSDLYVRNRQFVNQYLMELYGFPISSERHTSSAIFARRLYRLGERFLIRVLGQSDRVITTLWNDGSPHRYPIIEKLALVCISKGRKDLCEYLDKEGCFVDKEKRVVILHVVYKQHSYHSANIQQDRALSVLRQEVIHPLTGAYYTGLNVIQDHTTMLLNLNDIVRGEYIGHMVYNRSELIERTDTVENRLKAIYSWMSKNKRRLIGDNDTFYNDVVHILDDYLHSAELNDLSPELERVKKAIQNMYAYIRQAHHIHSITLLEKADSNDNAKSCLARYQTANTLLREMKFELVHYFNDLIEQLFAAVDKMLNDMYVRKKYIFPTEDKLTSYGKNVRKAYLLMVSLLDELKDIQKAHTVHE